MTVQARFPPLAKSALKGLIGPDGDEDGQDGKGRPCLGHLSEGVAFHLERRFLTGETEDVFRLPEPEKEGERDQAHQGRGDVGQLGTDEVGGQKLRDCEGASADQDCRPGLAHSAPAVHDEDDPGRDKKRKEGQLASGHRADLERIDAGDLPSDKNRNAHCTEGHGRGVGDETEARGIERVESQTGQQGGRDCHRRAKARCAFEKCAERKADQKHLQALVFGNGDHRGPDDFKLPGPDGDFVQEYGHDDNPCDRPQSEEKTGARGCQRHGNGHSEEKDRHQKCEDDSDRAGEIPLHAEKSQCNWPRR